MELWSDYEGKTVAGRFPLERLVGPSGRSAVFETKDELGQPAVIRLVETLNYEEEEILQRWRRVEALGQENLLRMREMGQTELGGTHLVYALLEPTDAELEEALRERALTTEETKQIGTSLVKALAALHEAGLVHEHVEASYVLGSGEVVKLRSDCVRETPEGIEGAVARARDVRDLALLLHRALTLKKEVSEVGVGLALSAPFETIVRDGMDGIWGLEEIEAALAERAPVAVTPPRPDAAWKVPAAVPRIYTTEAGAGRAEAQGVVARARAGVIPVAGPGVGVDGAGGVGAESGFGRLPEAPSDSGGAGANGGSGQGAVARLALRTEMPEGSRGVVPVGRASRLGGVEGGTQVGSGVTRVDGAAEDRTRTVPVESFRETVSRAPTAPQLIRTVEPAGERAGDVEIERWTVSPVVEPGSSGAVEAKSPMATEVGTPPGEREAGRVTEDVGVGAFARRGDLGGARPTAPDRIVVEPERVDGGMRRRLLLGGVGVAAIAAAAFGVHAWRGGPAASVAGTVSRSAPATVAPAAPASGGIGQAAGTGVPAATPQVAGGRDMAAGAAGDAGEGVLDGRHRRRKGRERGERALVGGGAREGGQADWRVVAYTFRRENQAEHKAKQIAERHGALRPQVFSPSGQAPYLVALGGWMSAEEAMALRERARREGLPRDVYMQNYRRER